MPESQKKDILKVHFIATEEPNMQLSATPIANGIYAVGANDPNETHFHGYAVHHGVTYNAYLTENGDGTYTLIDTVRREKADELLSRIA